MKINNIIMIRDSLLNIMSFPYPYFIVSELINTYYLIENIIESYNEELKTIYYKYSDKDDDGNINIKDGEIIIKEDKMSDCYSEVKLLNDKEIDFNTKVITISSEYIQQYNIIPKDIIILKEIINFI